MKTLVMRMAQSMVDYPDRVNVNEVNSGQTSILELRVAGEDVGKVIGKQGKNAQALRTILSAAASKSRKKAILEIID